VRERAHPESVSQENRAGVVFRRELQLTWIGRTSPMLVGRLRGRPVVSVGTLWWPALAMPYPVPPNPVEKNHQTGVDGSVGDGRLYLVW